MPHRRGRSRWQLGATGDWDDVADLSRYALASGTSAARQRKSLRRRGRPSDVVDQLIGDTAVDSPRGGEFANSD
jgi:carboxylate-amine ligase